MHTCPTTQEDGGVGEWEQSLWVLTQVCVPFLPIRPLLPAHPLHALPKVHELFRFTS